MACRIFILQVIWYQTLYLNKGDFKFEDITDKAGVNGMGRWGRGVSVIDINNDGLADIYVCNTIYKDSLRRRNLLYINKGRIKMAFPILQNRPAEYGLDIHVQSTMASFFDYDNDGDLDMYLTVNEATSGYNPNRFGRTANNNFHSAAEAGYTKMIGMLSGSILFFMMFPSRLVLPSMDLVMAQPLPILTAMAGKTSM